MVYCHFHVTHQQKPTSLAAIFIGKCDAARAHSVYKEANVQYACVTSLIHNLAGQKQQESCGDWATTQSHPQFAWIG